MSTLKNQLYQYCQNFLNEKRLLLENEMHLLQVQANDETKSSAGDKYETTRAMIHLEIEKHRLQLVELSKQKALLDSIKIDRETRMVQPGSIVMTDQANYFLSISAGQMLVDETHFICISSSSPVGRQMMGLKAGDSFSFNNRHYRISSIQ